MTYVLRVFPKQDSINCPDFVRKFFLSFEMWMTSKGYQIKKKTSAFNSILTEFYNYFFLFTLLAAVCEFKIIGGKTPNDVSLQCYSSLRQTKKTGLKLFNQWRIKTKKMLLLLTCNGKWRKMPWWIFHAILVLLSSLISGKE